MEGVEGKEEWRERSGAGGKGGEWKGVGWGMQMASWSVKLYNMSNCGRRVLQLFVLSASSCRSTASRCRSLSTVHALIISGCER